VHFTSHEEKKANGTIMSLITPHWYRTYIYHSHNIKHANTKRTSEYTRNGWQKKSGKTITLHYTKNWRTQSEFS